MNENLKVCNNEENTKNNEEKDESLNSSTSSSSINQYNYNIGFKSKLSLKNIELFDQSPNQRKFSAPVSFSENFVLNFIKIGKDTRGSYFNKLISKGLLNSSYEKKNLNLIILFYLIWMIHYYALLY